MAGIQPPVLVTGIDPKLAVHRSNNQNRDATPGQKAMAFAMQFPNGHQGKRTDLLPESKKLSGYEQKNISNARFILRNNPPAADSPFPQYALDVMAGRMTLTEAYDATQKDVARREEEERQERLRMLKNVHI